MTTTHVNIVYKHHLVRGCVTWTWTWKLEAGFSSLKFTLPGLKSAENREKDAYDTQHKEEFTTTQTVVLNLESFSARSRSLYVVVRLSVHSVVYRLSSVCNVRVPYSGDWNFRQCFCAIWYVGHLL